MVEPHGMDEQQEISEFAERAERLIDRRNLIKMGGRTLVLPVLISLCVTPEAMGQAGSNPGMMVGMMVGGGMGMGMGGMM